MICGLWAAGGVIAGVLALILAGGIWDALTTSADAACNKLGRG